MRVTIVVRSWLWRNKTYSTKMHGWPWRSWHGNLYSVSRDANPPINDQILMRCYKKANGYHLQLFPSYKIHWFTKCDTWSQEVKKKPTTTVFSIHFRNVFLKICDCIGWYACSVSNVIFFLHYTWTFRWHTDWTLCISLPVPIATRDSWYVWNWTEIFNFQLLQAFDCFVVCVHTGWWSWNIAWTRWEFEPAID